MVMGGAAAMPLGPSETLNTIFGYPTGESKRRGMALINCPECDAKVSDKAPTCPQCGVPIFRESKVVIYGYTQQFAINPKVQVFWNGVLRGEVRKGERLEFPIGSDGEMLFKSSLRSASLKIPAGRVTNIKLSWDRITGKLIPQIVDSVTPGA